jgi:hypothetical protein
LVGWRVALLYAARPIAQWSVVETQEWISNFEDWVEDSVLITEHKIDGQTLVRARACVLHAYVRGHSDVRWRPRNQAGMSEEELKDKLNVTDDNVGPLMDKIAKIKNISNHLTNGASPAPPRSYALTQVPHILCQLCCCVTADRVETVVMDKKPAASTSGSSGAGDSTYSRLSRQ